MRSYEQTIRVVTYAESEEEAMKLNHQIIDGINQGNERAVATIVRND